MTTPAYMSGLAATVGPELVSKIECSKVLVVGSGGIGCELLKNLALTGFRDVQVVDLDTIDVSNLNRQLLFRSQHVGQPKCTVACQVAKNMMVDDNDKITYQAHHGNVCDNSKFNVHFVAKFDVVLNALDNVTARRRVNRLCLAAAVPLVEAGTTGYLGQVNVIDKASGVACYECTTQETQKVYPVCTIRSTPESSVHTVVWAKELYKLLFGDKMEESMLYEGAGGDEEEDGGEAKEEQVDEEADGNNTGPSTYMESVETFRKLIADQKANGSKTDNTAGVVAAAQNMLKTLYIDEINKQLGMGRYKTAKKTPAPLNMDDITHGTANFDPPPSTQKAADQIWSHQECIAEWTACLVQAHRDASSLLPEFDKDDAMAMRLVTAASNLRSHAFSIEPIQSLYSAKGIAGNIIPAIATTNAIVAGLQIVQVLNIFKAQLALAKDDTAENKKGGILSEYCHYVNCIRNKTRNGLYLTASRLEKPNPKCFVCRQATIPLTINVRDWTLNRLLTRIIKEQLGFEEPTIMLEGGNIIWEEGEDADSEAFEVNLEKGLDSLPSGGVQHGTVLRIEDFSQDLEVDVCITHQEVWEGEQYDNPDQQFVVGGDVPTPVASAATAAPAEKPTGNAKNGGDDDDSDDDDIVLVVDEPDEKPAHKRSLDNGGGPPTKRAKNKAQNGDKSNAKAVPEQDVIEID